MRSAKNVKFIGLLLLLAVGGLGTFAYLWNPERPAPGFDDKADLSASQVDASEAHDFNISAATACSSLHRYKINSFTTLKTASLPGSDRQAAVQSDLIITPKAYGNGVLLTEMTFRDVRASGDLLAFSVKDPIKLYVLANNKGQIEQILKPSAGESSALVALYNLAFSLQYATPEVFSAPEAKMVERDDYGSLEVIYRQKSTSTFEKQRLARINTGGTQPVQVEKSEMTYSLLKGGYLKDFEQNETSVFSNAAGQSALTGETSLNLKYQASINLAPEQREECLGLDPSKLISSMGLVPAGADLNRESISYKADSKSLVDPSQSFAELVDTLKNSTDNSSDQRTAIFKLTNIVSDHSGYAKEVEAHLLKNLDDQKYAFLLIGVLGGALSEEAQDSLGRFLKNLQGSGSHPDLLLRAIRAQQLNEAPAASNVEVLKAIYNDKNTPQEIQEAAVFAATATSQRRSDASFNADFAGELMREFKSSAEPRAQLVILEALGNLASPSALNFLSELINDHHSASAVAVAAMRNMKDAKAESLLINTASSAQQPVDVRNEALITLRYHQPSAQTVDQLMTLYRQTSASSNDGKMLRGQIIQTLQGFAETGHVDRINKFFMELDAPKGASGAEATVF